MSDWDSELRARLAHLSLDAHREAEIIEELSQHLDDRYRERRSAGASDDVARAAALSELDEGTAFAEALSAAERSVDPEPTVSGGTRDGSGPVRLLSAFALAAVLLAAIGIYGVIALNVGARMHELGVRVALGARAADVVWMILRHGLWLAMLGVGVGLGGAVWLTRYLRSLLFGIGQFDAATFVVVSLILGAVGAAACLRPAWRATRADPIGALRSE